MVQGGWGGVKKITMEEFIYRANIQEILLLFCWLALRRFHEPTPVAIGSYVGSLMAGVRVKQNIVALHGVVSRMLVLG